MVHRYTYVRSFAFGISGHFHAGPNLRYPAYKFSPAYVVNFSWTKRGPFKRAPVYTYPDLFGRPIHGLLPRAKPAGL